MTASQRGLARITAAAWRASPPLGWVPVTSGFGCGTFAASGTGVVRGILGQPRLYGVAVHGVPSNSSIANKYATFGVGGATLLSRSLASAAASEERGNKKGGGKVLFLATCLLAAGGGAVAAQRLGYLNTTGAGEAGAESSPSAGGKPRTGPAAEKDYGAVRDAVAEMLDAENHDDGSFGPILVRLAWHASGTYDKASNAGGSNGATMRYPAEANHEANAGLHIAREKLEPLKKRFPWISYADLWTLAGAVAVEEMGGPHIAWRPGRTDNPDASNCPPDGRLPDAALGAAHVRDIFYRMGFNDQEIVALNGAHALGRCHADRSGFDGPWTFAPTTFSNQFFIMLKDATWRKRKWDGPIQYQDQSGTLMMLPTDMAMLWDKGFRKYVEMYAKDEDAFFKDFSNAFSKLLELGVPFPEGVPHTHV